MVRVATVSWQCDEAHSMFSKWTEGEKSEQVYRVGEGDPFDLFSLLCDTKGLSQCIDNRQSIKTIGEYGLQKHLATVNMVRRFA